MRHLAITFLLCAMTSVAQAEGDRSSLFSCGIQFGDKQLTYSPPAETTSRKEYQFKNQRLQFVAGTARTESLRFATPPRPAAFGTIEKRLPPVFSFATVGCSWR